MAQKTEKIYEEIAKRTGGRIYIGVVGPVRTGKSTFIHRFCDTVLTLLATNNYQKERIIDEIPQSAGGRTVMTTEPKFIPEEAMRIKLEDETELNVKLIDCVGYMVEGALGALEDGVPRLINTPWSDEPLPFDRAAEIGTEKVIREHSTIGILVTTDGSITDLPREAYVSAEERVARELCELQKPFAIVLNSAHPESEEAKRLATELEEKYSAPVALVNCTELNGEDIREILALVLGQFPITRLDFRIPEWTAALPRNHGVMENILSDIGALADRCARLGDVSRTVEDFDSMSLVRLDAGDGTGEIDIPLSREIYFATLSEITGLTLTTEADMFRAVKELAEVGKKYERVRAALDAVERDGWGVVMPTREEMTLDEPMTVKQGAGFGVKVSARAEAIQMIKTGIVAEVCPVVSSKEQADDVVARLAEEYESREGAIWDANILGRSLYDLVSDGMNAKLGHIPEEARGKLGETLERIINEGASGLICILV